MYFNCALIVLFIAFVTGCYQHNDSAGEADHIPYVKIASVKWAGENSLMLSGIVRARYETPIAFQVGGRITHRLCDAGKSVVQGQVLFKMDQRDFSQRAAAALANVLAAEAAVATAQADVKRMRAMQADNLISVRALDQSKLSEREALARKDAAKATQAQALNALSYAQLPAPVAGVLLEVTGEVGQVVQAGHSVAVLAHDGEREVELFFPDATKPPPRGVLITAPGASIQIRLREVSGAVDSKSRTWKARYSILNEGQALALGTVVRARFIIPGDDVPTFIVPIAALDERGQGPVLWKIVNGKAHTVKVQVVSITLETARVRGNLNNDEKIIALGTHLLMSDMAVKALAQ